MHLTTSPLFNSLSSMTQSIEGGSPATVAMEACLAEIREKCTPAIPDYYVECAFLHPNSPFGDWATVSCAGKKLRVGLELSPELQEAIAREIDEQARAAVTRMQVGA